MKKLLYITHLSGRRVNRFWHSSIKAAQELGYEFHLACNMNEAEHPIWEEECAANNIITHQIDFNRNPLNHSNLRASKQITKLLHSENFEIIHCNTPVGGLIGRMCARKANIPKVIYQVHGFHFWKGAPAINWLVYYPVERWLARYTDILITINQEDYKRAQKFKARKVVFVPGVGIDTDLFKKSPEKVELLKKEMSIPQNATVLLSVGELIRRKNHKAVIEAIRDLDNIYYIICGQGPLYEEYKELTEKLGNSDRVILTGYRTDVKDFYNIANIYIFPSYQEGLSVSLMEAMASELPCVVSDIRGNVDLIDDEELRFLPGDRLRIREILSKILSDRNSMISARIRNRQKVLQYNTENIVSELKIIYSMNNE